MHHNKAADLDLLCSMISTEPCVRASLQVVMNGCLHNEIGVRENGKPLKNVFLELIQQTYVPFFRNAIICALAVGFVPFVLRKRKGVLTPCCLPLGSFEWSVEHQKPGRDFKSADVAGLTWYSVTSRLETVENSNIFVFPYEDPIMFHETRLVTPMSGLMQRYREMREAVARSLHRNAWNIAKHVVVTEQVDVKDQTTSGIQLLDEQRRYYLTGHHNQMRHDHLLRLRNQDGQFQRTVTEGIFAHVRSEFDDHDASEIGSKRACAHIMPPNVQVTELSPIEETDDSEGLYTRFARDVVTFFQVQSAMGMRTEAASRGGTGKSDNIEGMQESEHRSFIVLCDFLQRLGEYAYCKSYSVQIENVEFKFEPVPIRDPEDPAVKKANAEVAHEEVSTRETEANIGKIAAETAKTRAEVAVSKEQAQKTKAETAKTTAEVGVTEAQKGKTQAETRKTSAEVGATVAQVDKTRAETKKTAADAKASAQGPAKKAKK